MGSHGVSFQRAPDDVGNRPVRITGSLEEPSVEVKADNEPFGRQAQIARIIAARGRRLCVREGQRK